MIFCPSYAGVGPRRRGPLGDERDGVGARVALGAERGGRDGADHCIRDLMKTCCWRRVGRALPNLPVPLQIHCVRQCAPLCLGIGRGYELPAAVSRH